MQQVAAIQHFAELAVKERLYSNCGNLVFHLSTLFRGVDLSGRRVLDIGGGWGMHSFYAALKGAEEVICLEPEAEGSTGGVRDKFLGLRTQLEAAQVTFAPVTFQAFEPQGKTFDVVLLHNSINHLDENACTTLHTDAASREIYRRILSKLSSICRSGAKLLVCDCSRNNFFALLGVKNPFVKSIEWHKHQAPEVWAALLCEVGFAKPRITWSSLNTLRGFGRVFLGNRFASYFLNSHFRLTMEKQ